MVETLNYREFELEYICPNKTCSDKMVLESNDNHSLNSLKGNNIVALIKFYNNLTNNNYLFFENIFRILRSIISSKNKYKNS